MRGHRGVWGPTYLALLLAAVLSPCTLSCAPLAFVTGISGWDFALNVVLFVPFAGLFARRPPWRAVALAFLLSLSIECVQRYLFRSPNPWDLLANTLGAGLGAWALPARSRPILTRASRQTMALTCALAAGLSGLWLTHTHKLTPQPSFSGWQDMDLVLGCEQDTKPNFRGVIRGLTVFDRTLGPPWPTRFADLGVLEPQGPTFAVDFTRQEASLSGLTKRTEVSLSPPPSVQLAPDGLHLGDGCWFLDAASAHHIKTQVAASGRLSLAMELALPASPEPRRARIFALTQMHSSWDFSVGHEGRRLILWMRLGSIPDAYDDPLGETGLLPVTPGEAGMAVFTMDDTTIRGVWNGQCRRERLYVMLGRPFLLGRGLGFSLAVLAALGAFAAALAMPGRGAVWAVLPGAGLMVGWMAQAGLLEVMKSLQPNLLAPAVWTTGAVLVSVLRRQRLTFWRE